MSKVPPSCPARSAMLRSPLRRPPAGTPTPLSATVSRTSRPSVSSTTSARSARACRAMLVSASESTATTWSAVSLGTSVSIRPAIRTLGANPSTGAASPTTRTARARSRPVPSLPSAGWERRPKMVERMIFMVSSRSSTARSTRSEASLCSMNRPALCSVMPVANSRWMARSCRSRAMRSRSSRTAICSASARRSASSIATAACAAKPWSGSVSLSVNGLRAAERTSRTMPRTRSPEPIGTATAGPRSSRR